MLYINDLYVLISLCIAIKLVAVFIIVQRTLKLYEAQYQGNIYRGQHCNKKAKVEHVNGKDDPNERNKKVIQWIKGNYIADQGHRTRSLHIYEHYKSYCTASNTVPVSHQNFNRLFEVAFSNVQKLRKNSVRGLPNKYAYYYDIRAKGPDDNWTFNNRYVLLAFCTMIITVLVMFYYYTH